MKILKVRTKIEILLAVLFIFLIIVASAAAITRTITDSSDNSYTFIRNSNGNYWEATGSNLQLAINDLSGGGTVFVPSGTFDIISDLTMQNNIWLQGSGIGNTILRQADGTSFNSGIIRCISKNNFTISDLTIYGNRDNIVVGYNGIDVNGCTDFVIRNVYIDKPAKNAIRVYGWSQRGLINNIHATGISGWYQALSINDVRETVFNNGIFWDADTGHLLDFCDIIDCTIENLIVKDAKMGMKITSTSDYSHNNVFNNLIFENIAYGSEGIKIERTRKSSFNNFYLDGGAGFLVFSSCSYLNFNNIQIEGSGNIGLSLNGNFINANNIQVRDSASFGLEIRGSNISLSNSIFLNSGNYNLMENAKNIDIINCKFLDGASYGLVIKNSHYFKIIGCNFINNNQDAIDLTLSPNSNYTISGCFFRQNYKAIDIGATDNYYIIMGNTCFGDEIDDKNSSATKIIENNIVTII